MSTPEGILKAAVLAVLPLCGVRAWHTPAGTRNGGRTRMAKKGTVDIIGWRLSDARFVAIETKVKPRKATEEQLEFIAAVKAAGGIAGVAYTVQEAMEIVRAG